VIRGWIRKFKASSNEQYLLQIIWHQPVRTASVVRALITASPNSTSGLILPEV